jgi:hypothetical protein
MPGITLRTRGKRGRVRKITVTGTIEKFCKFFRRAHPDVHIFASTPIPAAPLDTARLRVRLPRYGRFIL